MSDLRNDLIYYKSQWDYYENWIVNKLSTINLNASDRSIVNSIKKIIMDNLSYEITNDLIYTAVTIGRGQCYHYAHLFRDMCSAVGIKCDYVENEIHAWNYVYIDGQKIKEDVTNEDPC